MVINELAEYKVVLRVAVVCFLCRVAIVGVSIKPTATDRCNICQQLSAAALPVSQPAVSEIYTVVLL